MAQTFAIIAALFGVMAFVLESFLFGRQSVQVFLLGKPEPAAGVRMWAFNQGFYNLFLAIITIVGLVVLGSDDAVGWTLVLAGTGSMLAAAVVLLTHDGRMLRAGVTQGTLPALAVACTLLQL